MESIGYDLETMKRGETLSNGRTLARVDRRGKGGHFAAWEQPEMFPDEACAGFRILR